VDEKQDKQITEMADKNRQISLKMKAVCILWNALQRAEEFVTFIALYPE